MAVKAPFKNQQHETIKAILPGAWLHSNGSAPSTWRFGSREFIIHDDLKVYELLDNDSFEEVCLGDFPEALKLLS